MVDGEDYRPGLAKPGIGSSSTPPFRFPEFSARDAKSPVPEQLEALAYVRFGSLAGSDALEDADRPGAIPGPSAEVMYQHQHASFRAQQTRRCPAARHRPP